MYIYIYLIYYTILSLPKCVWCMAYTSKGLGGRFLPNSRTLALVLVLRILNNIATVWAMQASLKNKRTIDACPLD